MIQNKITLYNRVGGAIVFLISFLIYYLTVEPTTSFWDCGEFIAASYKLEIGHPPGAPLYLLISRFFSLFASSPEQVALMVNMVSVVASAFTILFLFWTITHFAQKTIKQSNELSISLIIVILGSGVVGSLSYAFSDTFWFSAVEAEVYALSSLFTAFVFWAILQWEKEEASKFANRWLILIAFVMGLSIGVHLLNLLTIPALVFVYYFKKYKTTPKGILSASAISILLLGFLMYGIIPQVVFLATQFELLFVNAMGMSFGSGLVAYFIILAAIFIFGIYFSQKRKMPILNTILLSITVILIGYSSYTVIVIRSQADTPMNENQPDNVFSLLSYLNREQYGNRPLLSGGYYDSEYKRDASGNVISKRLYTYRKGEIKYEKIKKSNPNYEFKSGETTLFPRMYSRNASHASAYKSWGGVPTGSRPNIIHNIRFFLKYQIGQMYFRYFMWNFSGRQNDEQGHGGITKGNWITGISPIDELMLGNQSELPSQSKNDKSKNKYYLLPLLLGLAGLLYTFSKSEKSFTVIMLLFFFTGIAIVLYLNQTPYQPRERDYAYAGSFYAFAIWIGMGTFALFTGVKKILNEKSAAISAVTLTAAVPLLMAVQNYDDHDRSDRYTARDFAKNYLDSCAPNAILFTYGDNDTFPLWYLQEAEGYRTDVRVVNLSLLGTDWYINQVQKQAYESAPLPFTMPKKLYQKGKRDVLYLMENSDFFIDEKYAYNPQRFKSPFQKIQNQLIALLNNSTFPQIAHDDFLTITEGKLSPIETLSLVEKMQEPAQLSRFEFNAEEIKAIHTTLLSFIGEVSQGNLPLNYAMDFAAFDADYTKLSPGSSSEGVFLPSKRFSIPVDSSDIKEIPFNKSEKSRIVSDVEFELNKRYIFKDGLAVLEILARNNWERPVYFATSVGKSNHFGLSKYFRLEGFAYRLVPIENTAKLGVGSINSEIMYNNMMNFSWGNIKDKSVLIDSNNRRVISIMKIRETFARLASALIADGEKEQALEVLNKCIEELPGSQVPLDDSIYPIVENYYKIGEFEKANALVLKTINRFSEHYKWYNSLSTSMQPYISHERTNLDSTVGEFLKLAEKYEQFELIKQISSKIN